MGCSTCLTPLQESCFVTIQNLDTNINKLNHQKRFPAHVELGTCRTSLVSPKQSVLSIFVWPRMQHHLQSLDATSLQLKPRAIWGMAPLHLTKQKLLWQAIIGHPEDVS